MHVNLNEYSSYKLRAYLVLSTCSIFSNKNR